MVFPLLERDVLKTKEERENELLLKATSKEDLETAVMLKMKSITNADESVCRSLLETNNYDLKTSVEAFFASS